LPNVIRIFSIQEIGMFGKLCPMSKSYKSNKLIILILNILYDLLDFEETSISIGSYTNYFS